MEATTTRNISIGPGFLGCLAIVLIALKVSGHADIGWWVATLPLWIVPVVIVVSVVLSLVLTLLVIVGGLIVVGLMAIFER